MSNTQRSCLLARLLESSEEGGGGGGGIPSAQPLADRQPPTPPKDEIMLKSSRMHLEMRGFEPRGIDDPTISIGGRVLTLESDSGFEREAFLF